MHHQRRGRSDYVIWSRPGVNETDHTNRVFSFVVVVCCRCRWSRFEVSMYLYVLRCSSFCATATFAVMFLLKYLFNVCTFYCLWILGVHRLSDARWNLGVHALTDALATPWLPVEAPVQVDMHRRSGGGDAWGVLRRVRRILGIRSPPDA